MSSQETIEAEQEFTHTEEIIDVNAIPSPQVEPVSTTLVEEEEKAPTMVGMDIDLHDSAHGHDPLTTDNPEQPSKVEATHITNGDDSERIESDEPRPQPMVGSM